MSEQQPTDWPTDARACLELTGRLYLALDYALQGEKDRKSLAEARRTLAEARTFLAHPEPNSTPLGRLRLELKALGDAASTVAGAIQCDCCKSAHFGNAGKAQAYRHALDLVMAMEREQA